MNSKTLPSQTRIIGSVICIVCLLAWGGCTDGLPTRVPVSGTVKIDGKPLEGGSIMVIPDNQRPAGGSIGPDGRFSLSSYERNDGVVTGTHKVTVQFTQILGERDTRWLTPKKYGNARSTDIVVTIDGPTNDLVINLTWDGKKPFVERM